MFVQEEGLLRVPLKDVPRAVKDEQFEHVWRCGDWSFDIRDDYDLEYIEATILTWIGWHQFVRTNGYGQLEEGNDGAETSG